MSGGATSGGGEMDPGTGQQAGLSREALLDILDHVPVAVAVLSGDEFRHVYTNEAMRALMPGVPMAGRTVAEVWGPIIEEILPRLRQVIATGEPHVTADRPYLLPGVPGRPPEERHFTLEFKPMVFDGARAVRVEARETTAAVLAHRDARAAAAEAEARADILSEVFDRMADGFISLDDGWVIRYVNSRGEELLQRSSEELVGHNIWELMPEAVGTRFYDEYHRAMRDQVPVQFDEYYPPLDMWASVHIFPSPSGLSVFLSNITSQKQAEDALALSEGQLRAVIENSPDVVLMKDLQGRFLRVNREFTRVFGLSAEELVGKTDFEVLPRDVAERLHDNDRAVIEKGVPLQFEEDVHTVGGEHRVYLTTKFPLRDASGRLYGTAGISVDVTERSRQQRRLAASEERFRKIFDEGPIGIVLLSAVDFHIVDANETYASMVGYDKAELASLDLFDVTADEDDTKARELAQAVVAGEIPYYRLDKRYRRKDGSTLWVSATGSLLRDDEGGPTVILGMVQDITQRKQAEDALRDKDRAIRTAYSEVIGAVTGGKLVLMTEDEIVPALGRDVLGKWDVDEYVKLAPVRAAVADALEAAGMAGQDCEDYVLAAGEAMTNAVKHVGSGVVRVRRTADAVQTEVSDHGPGIDFEDLPKAALVPGFSTAQTLGMGFTIMLGVCDRVLLSTQPGHTTIVLEKSL